MTKIPTIRKITGWKGKLMYVTSDMIADMEECLKLEGKSVNNENMCNLLTDCFYNKFNRM